MHAYYDMEREVRWLHEVREGTSVPDDLAQVVHLALLCATENCDTTGLQAIVQLAERKAFNATKSQNYRRLKDGTPDLATRFFRTACWWNELARIAADFESRCQVSPSPPSSDSKRTN